MLHFKFYELQRGEAHKTVRQVDRRGGLHSEAVRRAAHKPERHQVGLAGEQNLHEDSEAVLRQIHLPQETKPVRGEALLDHRGDGKIPRGGSEVQISVGKHQIRVFPKPLYLPDQEPLQRD